jgi:hypothetical protein
MDVSQIFPNLFVGSCPTSTEDIDRLKAKFGVTAVLNIQTHDDMAYWGINWDRLEPYYRETGVEVRRVPPRTSRLPCMRHFPLAQRRDGKP